MDSDIKISEQFLSIICIDGKTILYDNDISEDCFLKGLLNNNFKEISNIYDMKKYNIKIEHINLMKKFYHLGYLENKELFNYKTEKYLLNKIDYYEDMIINNQLKAIYPDFYECIIKTNNYIINYLNDKKNYNPKSLDDDIKQEYNYIIIPLVATSRIDDYIKNGWHMIDIDNTTITLRIKKC